MTNDISSNEAGMIAHIDDLTDALNSRELALQAIAHMRTDDDTKWREIALLCITIAQVELDPEIAEMMAHMDAAARA